MKRQTLWISLFFLLAGLVLFAGPSDPPSVSAQAPEPTAQPGAAVSDNDVNRVAKKLYCPVCPNTPLDVCETQACKDWRAQIRDQLVSGWSDQQVMDYFALQYGERVLAEPERGGFNSLVWMLPVLVVMLGLLLVGLILKSWQTSRKPTPAVVQQAVSGTPAIPQDILAKIESEIRQLD